MLIIAVIGAYVYGGSALAASDAHCAGSWAKIKSTKSASVVRNFLRPCGASAVAANARALLAKLQAPPKTAVDEKPVRRVRVIETINVSQDMTVQQLMSAASRLIGRNEPARARTAYEYGCQKDHSMACYQLALTYENTNYGDVDNKNLVEFLRKSCEIDDNSDLNKGYFCALYANYVSDERYGTPNFEAEKIAQERACAFNRAFSCREAGIMYANEKYGKTDFDKYKFLVRRSCDLKYALGCDTARLVSFDINKDFSNVQRYFELSIEYDKNIKPFCGNNFQDDCVALADKYLTLNASLRTERKLLLYDSACQEKLKEACEKASALRLPEIIKRLNDVKALNRN
jgi:uncharacterized protein